MVRTRFAPSPTGYLHIGGARTALFNYLFTRHENGRMILRIEDTDLERSKDEYTKDIIEGLKWLGIDWDEGPYFQKERMEEYRKFANMLLEKDLAYKCYCPTEVLEEKRKKALKEGKKPSYDRTCRDKNFNYPERPFVIRFKTPLSGTVSFNDIIRGTITFDYEELDDLIILRSDNTPTYNFTVVVDDALMNITHVIRGDDHINNTPRQILIYQALGYRIPEFAHVPMILGKDRTKLSKRHGAVSILEYRREGFLPEALINYIARLGWSYKDQEIFSKQELIEKFELKDVGKSPSIFDVEKLLWVNSYYIKTLPLEVVSERLIPYLLELGIYAEPNNYLYKAVDTLRTRAKTLKEMAQMAYFYYKEDYDFENKAKEKFFTKKGKEILIAFLDGFQKIENLDENSLRDIFDRVCKEFDVKLVDAVQVVRLAISGRLATPGIFEVIEIIGKESTKRRIERAIGEIPY
ncbi:MAG: glutamate--tRNA ligase [Deltaproteobacteria bacterium]|nr:glutamate--tRNA ligase [Deltaproteobacteria bacterium]